MNPGEKRIKRDRSTGLFFVWKCTVPKVSNRSINVIDQNLRDALLFNFQDFEFELATGRFRFHHISNFVIHQRLPNRGLI